MSRILNVLPEDYTKLPFCLHSLDVNYPQESVKRVNGLQNFSQILFVSDGTGILNCRGQSFALKKGSAFFVDKNIPNEYINTGNLISSYIAVYSDIANCVAKHYGYDGFMYLENTDVEFFKNLISDIKSEFLGDRRDGIISTMIYSLYIDFFEQIRIDNDKHIQNTLLYIEKNYNTKITLEKLSKVNGSSVSKLCHDFKKEYGMTVFEYIVNYRLKSAKMLMETDKTISVKDASIMSGFDDVSYFCKAYKKKFGVTPACDKTQF